jgi:predicted XRE-type DNA-binding protein
MGVRRFDSVWEAIADRTEEAVNLRLRSELMDKITALIDGKGWTQAEAASRCGVMQPRMNDLFRGRLSLDALVNIGAKLGAYSLSH